MSATQTTSDWLATAAPVAEALVVLALSVVAGRLLGAALARGIRRFASPGWEQMARRFTSWGFIGLGLANALQVVGIDLSVLLGAAGFVTIAVGFAAQTSTTNFLSGLFLMLESALKVGDFIEVAGLSGEVISIDPLSVRMRTFDNRLVRIPNETLVKANLTNLSGFPIRRIDLPLTVPQEANLVAARDALARLGEAEPRVLQHPAPNIMVLGFEGGHARLQASYWAAADVWVAVRTSLACSIPATLASAGAPLSTPRLELSRRDLTASPAPQDA